MGNVSLNHFVGIAALGALLEKEGTFKQLNQRIINRTQVEKLDTLTHLPLILPIKKRNCKSSPFDLFERTLVNNCTSYQI